MKKTNTRNRIVSILLVLVMLLTMVPITAVTANAAEPEWTTVNTFDELKEAMQRGTKTNIKLGKNINTNDEENHKHGLTSYDDILVGNTITLDLNGKKLTLNSGQNNVGSYINVTLGNLTVQDSVGGGEIFLNDEYKGGSTLILLLENGAFTLKSGTIRATTSGNEKSGITLIQSYGTVNIEGGTLTCTQKDGTDGRVHGDPNHWSSCYALKCFARDNVQTTITGGEFTGFVRISVKNNGKQNKITNVIFNSAVVLDLADKKNMTWAKPGLTIENVKVNGTLIINGVCYHEKSTDIAIVIGDGWYATLDVNDTNVWVYDYDLFKQTYEAGGNDVSKATFKQGYAPYQLKGGTVFCKFKRRCIFRKRGNVHLKETHSELTVDVVEFIFIFPEVFFQMLRVNVIKVVEIVRAFRVYTFVYTEKGSVFNSNKTVATVRTEETQWGCGVFPGRECLTTDFALILTVIPIVVIYVVMRRTTDRTAYIFENCAVVTSLYRFQKFMIFPFVIL